MPATDPEHGSSGFVCPACGGALWQRGEGESLTFECRIGDTFSALELWIQHSTARNTALQYAARSLAENAALARELATWARERGNERTAARLEEEAASEAQAFEQVQRMLGDLAVNGLSLVE